MKQVEFAANISIIVLAVLVGAMVMKPSVLHRSERSTGTPVGAKFVLPGSQIERGDTLVLVLSATCRYCTESASFYQRLQKELRRSDVSLAAVLPQEPGESARYLASLGLTISDVRQAQLAAIGVPATPTLLLLNRKGVITEKWVGQLPSQVEDEVIAAVLSHEGR